MFCLLRQMIEVDQRFMMHIASYPRCRKSGQEHTDC